MNRLTIAILGMLTTLGPLTIDLYLPAFPALARAFAASPTELQLTLAATTAGLAIGQIALGPISDRSGRIRPLLGAIALHLAASIGCALAPAVGLFICCRFLQGLGAAATTVLVMAIVRDLTSGTQLIRMLSRVTMITTGVPLLAPVIGAGMLAAGWRSIFFLLAGLSTVLCAAVLLLPRSAPTTPAQSSHLAPYRIVIADRTFRRVAVVGGMVYANVYSYVACSSLVFQGDYRLTPAQFSIVFLLNSLGIVVGVQLGGMIAGRMGSARALVRGTDAMLGAAVVLLLVDDLHSVVALEIVLWLFIVACGTCFPWAHAMALEENGDHAGTAAAIFGFATFGLAAAISPLAGLFGHVDVTTMALVLTACSLVGVVVQQRVVRQPENRAA